MLSSADARHLVLQYVSRVHAEGTSCLQTPCDALHCFFSRQVLQEDVAGSSKWRWLPAVGSATGVLLQSSTGLAAAAKAVLPVNAGSGAGCCDAVQVPSDVAHGGHGGDPCTASPTSGACAPAAGTALRAESGRTQSAASDNSEETHVTAEHIVSAPDNGSAPAVSAADPSPGDSLLMEKDLFQCRRPSGRAAAGGACNRTSGGLHAYRSSSPVSSNPTCLGPGYVASQQPSAQPPDAWHLHAEPQVCSIDVSDPSKWGLSPAVCTSWVCCAT